MYKEAIDILSTKSLRDSPQLKELLQCKSEYCKADYASSKMKKQLPFSPEIPRFSTIL
jgi:hypothetical protein